MYNTRQFTSYSARLEVSRDSSSRIPRLVPPASLRGCIVSLRPRLVRFLPLVLFCFSSFSISFLLVVFSLVRSVPRGDHPCETVYAPMFSSRFCSRLEKRGCVPIVRTPSIFARSYGFLLLPRPLLPHCSSYSLVSSATPAAPSSYALATMFSNLRVFFFLLCRFLFVSFRAPKCSPSTFFRRHRAISLSKDCPSCRKGSAWRWTLRRHCRCCSARCCDHRCPTGCSYNRSRLLHRTPRRMDCP